MTSKINKVTHIKKTTNFSIYIYFITGISNASFHRLTVVHCEAETSDSGEKVKEVEESKFLISESLKVTCKIRKKKENVCDQCNFYCSNLNALRTRMKIKYKVLLFITTIVLKTCVVHKGIVIGVTMAEQNIADFHVIKTNHFSANMTNSDCLR